LPRYERQSAYDANMSQLQKAHETCPHDAGPRSATELWAKVGDGVKG
jgi:hypothetical protein